MKAIVAIILFFCASQCYGTTYILARELKSIKIEEYRIVDATLKEAIEILNSNLPPDAKWSIIIEDPAVRERPVSITIRGFTADRILDILTAMVGCKYEFRGNGVYISHADSDNKPMLSGPFDPEQSVSGNSDLYEHLKGFVRSKCEHHTYSLPRVLTAMQDTKIPSLVFTDVPLSRVLEVMSYCTVDGSMLPPEQGIHYLFLTGKSSEEIIVNYNKKNTNPLELIQHIAESYNCVWWLSDTLVIISPIKNLQAEQVDNGENLADDVLQPHKYDEELVSKLLSIKVGLSYDEVINRLHELSAEYNIDDDSHAGPFSNKNDGVVKAVSIGFFHYYDEGKTDRITGASAVRISFGTDGNVLKIEKSIAMEKPSF